ncbi:uncharacterized protein LOC108095267 [Drosophila ficusphila]|uniref:uncharacterized protein LOC108095267 n=1 Tax=Drosophila ficusphila TaxID=30025 RepID=UPI0007E8762E|nr:uncharacterized protein LOC108095267 [Drosophila ficusphila]
MNTSSPFGDTPLNSSSRLSYAPGVHWIYRSYVEHSRIDMQAEDANAYVARALRLVIENVLAQLSTTLVVGISTRHLGTAQWFENMMNNLMDSWRMMAVQLLRIRPDLVATPVPGRKRVSLLMVDSYVGLLDTNITESNALFDDPDFYFIFLQARDKLIPKELQLILDHCLANFWLNCNVMVQTAQVEVLVYSYYPYTEKGCQEALPVLINRFDGRDWMRNAMMFPDKLTQMHGCPLTLLTWHQPPFVELVRDPQTNGSRLGGFEIQLLWHLARRMNFTLELANITLGSTAFRLADGANEGPIERLLQRNTNLSLGYFRRTALRSQLLTSPMSYYSANLVAVLQLERYSLSSLALLSFPFELPVWLFLLLSLLIHLAIHLPERRGNRRGGAGGLQVVALLLGAPLANLPRPWRHRLIATHWLWASIPLRICYQSLLFHLIRLQLYSTPSASLEQLLEEGFQGICSTNTQKLLNEMPQAARNPDSFRALDTPYDWDVLNALQRNRNRRIFAVANQDIAQSYIRSSLNPTGFHVVKQPVNVEFAGMYMPKHSFLYLKMDDAIRRLDAGGFILAWRRAAFASHRRGEHAQSTSRSFVSHGKLSGIYVIMAGMYLLASLVFAGEVLSRRRNWNLTIF